MTPEQFEQILESNARAIASNSQTIADARKETQIMVAESQKKIDSIYNLTAELVRDRLTTLQMLRSLNEDRVTNAEHLATIAENIANISQMNLQQNETLAKQSETLTKQNEILADIAQSLKKASE